MERVGEPDQSDLQSAVTRWISDDPGWGTESACWRADTSFLWGRMVEDAPWTPTGRDGWEKKLRCPRCTHDMSDYVPSGNVFASFASRVRIPGFGATGLRNVRCNCTSAHKDRPGDVDKGCGQSASVPGPGPDNGARPALVQPGSSVALLKDHDKWDTEASEARHKSLETVRTTAKDWAGTITAVLGLFALVAFIKGPESLTDLPTGKDGMTTIAGFNLDPARAVSGSIFLAGVLVVLAALVAALAAQGVPSWRARWDGTVLEDLTLRNARLTGWLVAGSRLLFLCGLAVLLFAMYVAFSSTVDAMQQPAPGPKAIVGAGTASVCGELKTAADGRVTVTPKGGSPMPVSGGSAVTLIPKCP